MGAALRELGYELDESELDRRRAEGKPIGRPHLADAVVRHPGNEQRLHEEGLAERSAFLEAYLIDGEPAFKPRITPTVSEAIAAIHDAGGVAVWAHPFWDIEASPEVLQTIDRFRDWGLDGVECFYATHTREQADLLADRRGSLGLLHDGIVRLPRAGAQAVLAVSRVQHVRARAVTRPDRGVGGPRRRPGRRADRFARRAPGGRGEAGAVRRPTR